MTEQRDSYSDVIRSLPNPGLGLGLRSKHFNYILEHNPEVDWFEVISENFMDSGGRPHHILRQLAERYPVVMHGVSLSIGSTDPLNKEYLTKLKLLAKEIKPLWISDHLCWTGVNSLNTHDLLPIVLNEESLKHICNRINRVQDFLHRPLVFENPSTYLTFKQSTINEWDFLRYMTEETGCGLLLDVNNVYVSAFNNDFDPVHYIHQLPHSRIVQMHIAGHQHCGTHIIDTHDRQVVQEVWKLFTLAWHLTGGVATLLEWDSNIPDFEVYHAELLKAKQHMSSIFDMELNPEKQEYSEEAVSNPVNFMINDIVVN
ncbi:DUF692 domain-containing protein [Mucilaginibacter sp. OK098]|uniref:MNIO family bufferin maturase n=1 Tax=Mucilaginibacter sp. OK098 TaxID=1855297 RepID=UPI000919E532|nr:DUF692 domain-containing protein [Mucilaginibacter sp. OK098]SHN10906.1 hypothetical protein SAMN05216524_105274 [Mucilaginibacter sp. OK098]